MSERKGPTKGVSPSSQRLSVRGVPRIPKRCYLILLSAMFLTSPAWPQQRPVDLTAQSIEDLMNIEVTSVSKKGEKLSRTAAAIFVITERAFRQSGATEHS